jgi:hypothetical protein
MRTIMLVLNFQYVFYTRHFKDVIPNSSNDFAEKSQHICFLFLFLTYKQNTNKIKHFNHKTNPIPNYLTKTANTHVLAVAAPAT